MQLSNVYTWATSTEENAEFKKQLAAAIATAAVAVLAESRDVANHDRRRVWAASVLASPNAPLDMANQMIWGVLGNTTIQGELSANGVVPDGDLAFTINSLIDVYAP